VADEWQERPKGQTLGYVTVVAAALFALVNLLLLTPRVEGWLRLVVITGSLTWFVIAWRTWRDARRLTR